MNEIVHLLCRLKIDSSVANICALVLPSSIHDISEFLAMLFQQAYAGTKQ